ncbi:MAG: protealysin inhibitor emfourin [Rhodococcus sp. (in: high G+C Gram-positive bacteria)]
MLIEVVRSGGIAGMIRRAQVDTDAIEDEAALEEWHRLVEQARPLLASYRDAPSLTTHRDGFVWTVSVDAATYSIDDASVRGPLRDLAQRALREGRRP